MTADEVCQAINEVAVGVCAPAASRLVSRDDPREAVSADALLDEAMREAIWRRFAQRFVTFDVRAAYSIWMQWYLNTLIPPVLLADVLLGQSVSVGLPTLRFVMSDDARVDAIRIEGASDGSGDDPFQRFGSLVHDHLAPLIEMWSSRTDVVARVFWSNAGHTFEAMLGRIESVSGPLPRLAEARRLFVERNWRGAPNPLFDAVRYVPERGAIARIRRVCCLQYLLPDRRFCRACPIDEARASRVDGPIS